MDRHLEVNRPVCARCGCTYKMKPMWCGQEAVVIEGTFDDNWQQRINDDWFGRNLTRQTAVECCGVSVVVQFYREVA